MSDVVVITVASGTPEPKRWAWPTSTTSLSTPSSPGREPDGVPGSPLTPPVACHAGAPVLRRRQRPLQRRAENKRSDSSRVMTG
ncbi:unnamed protein product [Boreogadus saida]